MQLPLFVHLKTSTCRMTFEGMRFLGYNVVVNSDRNKRDQVANGPYLFRVAPNFSDFMPILLLSACGKLL